MTEGSGGGFKIGVSLENWHSREGAEQKSEDSSKLGCFKLFFDSQIDNLYDIVSDSETLPLSCTVWIYHVRDQIHPYINNVLFLLTHQKTRKIL